MIRRTIFLILILFCLTLLIACGPSEEEIAAMTAAAATDTPMPTDTPLPTATATPTATPTPTETPVPYDLTVTVSDAEGAPIGGASVTLAELEEEQASDDAGQVGWGDLPGEAVNLSVSAQGYFDAEESATISRGPNEVAVTLERDPSGVLPAEACAPSETLLYVEDFQDGKAQGWGQITAATDSGAMNGWEIVEDAEVPGDYVLKLSNEATGAPADAGDGTYDQEFDNAVWRVWIKYNGDVIGTFIFLNWQHHPSPDGESRYPVQIGPAPNIMTALTRLSPDAGHFNVVPASHNGLRQNQWTLFELSSYEGVVEMWIDGVRYASWTDPNPLPAGGIGIELHTTEPGMTTFTFDDLVVCGLSAPFETMPEPEPEVEAAE
jgi:hypothetical protein